jgi:hypothetical protein
MKSAMNKEQWINLFREIGLNDAQMCQWHQAFESRHPKAHQEFLEWLGLPADEIAVIRKNSQPS